MKIRSSLGLCVPVGTAVFAAGLLLSGGPAGGETFRVENKVFVEKETEPRVESTTIFSDGVVYDFLKKPGEITIFDKVRGRFVLLDTARRVKTELTTEGVLRVTERLKEWAGMQPDPLLKFLADPQLDRQFDPDSGELTFSSPWVTYRVAPADAESAAIARQYREFSDWYLRLNTRINPGSRPPFARMIVNAELEARGEIPREVHLTLTPKGGLMPKRIRVRSQHRLIRRLVESDRDRIVQAGQFMAIFKAVDFDEYQEKIEIGDRR